MGNLDGAERMAEAIAQRVGLLMDEVAMMRAEQVGRAGGSLERDKAFMRLWVMGVKEDWGASARAYKLERMLQVR